MRGAIAAGDVTGKTGQSTASSLPGAKLPAVSQVAHILSDLWAFAFAVPSTQKSCLTP